MSNKYYGAVSSSNSSRHSQRQPLPDHRTPMHDPREETLRRARAQIAGGGDQNRYEHEHLYHRQTQRQDQVQLQRSLEASKQMLYGTFGNLLAILEEFEERELERKGMHHRLRKSHIPIPDQRYKRFEDVKCNVETQILLFENQCKACPIEVRQALHEELKWRTLGWTAVRTEMGVKDIQETDRYIAKLYEVLVKGRTEHKKPSRSGLTEGVMRETFQAFLYGDHDREVMDSSFRNDRDKKARAPETRYSENLKEGAHRISRAGIAGLEESLRQDLGRFTDCGKISLR